MKRILFHIVVFVVTTLLLLALIIVDGYAYGGDGAALWRWEQPRLSLLTPAPQTETVIRLESAPKRALFSALPTPPATWAISPLLRPY